MTKRNLIMLTAQGDALYDQRAVVKDLLLRGERVSQIQMTQDYGFTRLSAIIFDLKQEFLKEGNKFTIGGERKSGTNRYGNKCHWKEYYLIPNTQ